MACSSAEKQRLERLWLKYVGSGGGGKIKPALLKSIVRRRSERALINKCSRRR